jgi:hypothetical protein
MPVMLAFSIMCAVAMWAYSWDAASAALHDEVCQYTVEVVLTPLIKIILVYAATNLLHSSP